MAWFRKPRALDLGTFVEPEPLPESSIDDLVAESELLVGAAVRLAVKNLLILRSVRDGLDYDEELYIAAAREELLLLAAQKRGDAERTAEARADALKRSGRAQHFHDYLAAQQTGAPWHRPSWAGCETEQAEDVR